MPDSAREKSHHSHSICALPATHTAKRDPNNARGIPGLLNPDHRLAPFDPLNGSCSPLSVPTRLAHISSNVGFTASHSSPCPHPPSTPASPTPAARQIPDPGEDAVQRRLVGHRTGQHRVAVRRLHITMPSNICARRGPRCPRKRIS